MWEKLDALDIYLFQKIHTDWATTQLNSFFVFLSEFNDSTLFIICILTFIIFLFYRFGLKKGPLITAQIILSVGLSDFTSHSIVKQYIQRDRPRHHPEIKVDLLTRPHAGYSFTSNHAANSFALATSLSFIFVKGRLFFYLFAFLIAYSRVYVGVHFPFDVLFGGLLGYLIAFFIHKMKTTYLEKK